MSDNIKLEDVTRILENIKLKDATMSDGDQGQSESTILTEEQADLAKCAMCGESMDIESAPRADVIEEVQTRLACLVGSGFLHAMVFRMYKDSVIIGGDESSREAYEELLGRIVAYQNAYKESYLYNAVAQRDRERSADKPHVNEGSQ
ncbi:hypothetical protein Q9L58_009547 [Maublancomyces gigas]|uniref:Uncharacterized protein n=1 Tax=Discina gigas TaxID=1032678 RepID=A0ABR3G6K6_9PEZI